MRLSLARSRYLLVLRFGELPKELWLGQFPLKLLVRKVILTRDLIVYLHALYVVDDVQVAHIGVDSQS